MFTEKFTPTLQVVKRTVDFRKASKLSTAFNSGRIKASSAARSHRNEPAKLCFDVSSVYIERPSPRFDNLRNTCFLNEILQVNCLCPPLSFEQTCAVLQDM
jgi:hypothetical protein